MRMRAAFGGGTQKNYGEKKTVPKAGLRRGSSHRADPPTGDKCGGWPHGQGQEIVETLLENSPLVLLFVDLHGNYLYSNPQFACITGYTTEGPKSSRQWVRQAFADAAVRHQFLESWRRDDRDTTVNHHHQIRDKDGSTKRIRFWRNTLKDGSFLIAILADIAAPMEYQDRQKVPTIAFSRVSSFSPMRPLSSITRRGWWPGMGPSRR
jgi:PAS domain S-box-containing protein